MRRGGKSMKKIAEKITNNSILVLVISILLFIVSIFGYVNTRVNYDILVYLPDTIDTIKGENILIDGTDPDIEYLTLCGECYLKYVYGFK